MGCFSVVFEKVIHGNVDVPLPYDGPEFFDGHQCRQGLRQADPGHDDCRTLSVLRAKPCVETQRRVVGGKRSARRGASRAGGLMLEPTKWCDGQ
jgi:hypothetical protein